MAAERSVPAAMRDTASRWVTAREAGTLTAADEQALAAWLAADPLHARAFAEVERFWGAMGTDQVQNALRARYASDGHEVAQASRGRVSGRRILLPIAACFTLVIFAGVADLPTRLRADAMTETGERRAVSLPDGSTIELNTDSAIATDFTADARVIRLLKGEAAFTVAPDARRPFTVEAGGGSTTALGTRFLVRRDGADTDIVVTEHRVRLAWPAEDGSTRQLNAGQAARYGPGGITSSPGVDIDAATAWTRGVLIFVDRPLGEVVSELNRYHSGYIRVIGAELAARRVSGGFRTDDPVGAIDTLQGSLGIASTRLTNRLILLHR